MKHYFQWISFGFCILPTEHTVGEEALLNWTTFVITACALALANSAAFIDYYCYTVIHLDNVMHVRVRDIKNQ